MNSVDPDNREDSAQDSESRYRYLFEQSPFSIQIYSPDGWTRQANKAWENLFGVTVEMIRDYNILQDKQLMENGLMPYIRRGFAGEPTSVPAVKYDVSVEVPGASHVRWVRAYIYPVKVRDVITEVILMHEDVTAQVEAESALRDSEKLLRTVTDSLPVLISYVDYNLHYQFCNKTYEEWFDLSLDQIVGRPVQEVLGRSNFNKISEKLKRALSGDTINFEGYLEYKNGNERYVDVLMLPDMDDEKKVAGIYILANDRTAYVQAEEELQQYRNELAHLARLNTLGEMAARLAHELNQPLTAIKLFARTGAHELDAFKADTESLRSCLSVIETQAMRAGEIIRNIRQLAAKKAPQCSPVDINKLIQKAVEFIQPDTRRKSIVVNLNLDQHIPQVIVDSTQIQQVIINLLLNSIDALKGKEKKQRKILLTSEIHEDGYAGVRIIDNGCGMDKNNIERIFDSFFTTKGDRGMGMGLSICNSIIEGHGGKIWAESTLKEGSTFIFTLPIVNDF